MSKRHDIQDGLARLQQNYHHMSWRSGFQAFPFSRSPNPQPLSPLAFLLALGLNGLPLLYPILTAIELIDAWVQHRPFALDAVTKVLVSMALVILSIVQITRTCYEQFVHRRKPTTDTEN